MIDLGWTEVDLKTIQWLNLVF